MTSQADIVEATNQYLIPNYGRLPIAMVRGQGARIWDADGKEDIDLFAGFGSAGVTGHCHPTVMAAVKEQADTLTTSGNLFTNEPQVELARLIGEHGFGGRPPSRASAPKDGRRTLFPLDDNAVVFTTDVEERIVRIDPLDRAENA